MNIRTKRLVADILSGNEARARRAETKLKNLKDTTCIKPLLPCLLTWSGAPDTAADCAMNVIASIGDNDLTCDFLLERLRNGSETVRANAAWALRNAPQPKAVPHLKNCASHDRNEDVRTWSLHALKALAWRIPSLEKEVFEIFRRAAKDPRPGVRCAAYECLSHMNDPRCVAIIESALKDNDIGIREVHAPSWNRHKKNAHGNRQSPHAHGKARRCPKADRRPAQPETRHRTPDRPQKN
ncbi:MAG: HEAT repeat domain-containing protein [Elusimicrobia bacterium]|nr:HEAT repeat domain-containing protein [Elusimicrobiota bacterium]